MKRIPVYLINLDRDTDRLEFMNNQFMSLNIDYKRFPAINGRDLPDWLKPYFLNDSGNIASQLSAGEVGCYASHLAIMKRVADERCAAVVFEDDVSITAGFPALISEIISSDMPYDILRMSAIGQNRIAFTKAHFLGKWKAVRYLREPPNTGAYLITPEGARKFLNWKLLRKAPIDWDLCRVWENRLETLSLSPPPIIHNTLEGSSIDNMTEQGKRWQRSRIRMIRAMAKTVDDVNRLSYLCLTLATSGLKRANGR